MDHRDPCFGGHEIDITCEAATKYRENEGRGIWFCPESETTNHAFMGDTFCAYGCGRNILELRPNLELE